MMSRNRYSYFIFFILLVFFTSCDKETDSLAQQKLEEELVASRAFYPLGAGREWTYHIDTIYYRLDAGGMMTDTVSGTYKEFIQDTFLTHTGQTVYRVVKDVKDSLTGNWYTTDVYSLALQGNSLIRTEENTPLVDLVFPIKKGVSWKATALIDANNSILVKGKSIYLFKEWPDSRVTDLVSMSLFGSDHDVITIEDVLPDEDIILSQYSLRKYARGIGMIYKEQAFYTTQRTDLADFPWDQKAETGFVTRQTLLSYK